MADGALSRLVIVHRVLVVSRGPTCYLLFVVVVDQFGGIFATFQPVIYLAYFRIKLSNFCCAKVHLLISFKSGSAVIVSYTSVMNVLECVVIYADLPVGEACVFAVLCNKATRTS